MLDMVSDYIESKLENGEDFESIENSLAVEDQIKSGSPVLSVEYKYYSKNYNTMHGNIKINTFEMMGFIYNSCKKDEDHDLN